jgi:hypothetical protein
MKLMEWFFWRPERILVVSLAFFLGYLVIHTFRYKWSSVRSWPLLIPAIAWILFAIWERHCTIKESNIRVDLLLIYPVLIVVSIFGISVSIGSLISNFLKNKAADNSRGEGLKK